ncbi:MAG: hypothetical protein ACERKZ_03215 [Lachnotalea sp.]
MSNEFWIGLVIQMVAYGVSIGTIYGIITTRLKYIEQKVDKHNNVVERVYALERDTAVLTKEKEVANHRIDDLEDITGTGRNPATT